MNIEKSDIRVVRPLAGACRARYEQTSLMRRFAKDLGLG